MLLLLVQGFVVASFLLMSYLIFWCCIGWGGMSVIAPERYVLGLMVFFGWDAACIYLLRVYFGGEGVLIDEN